MFAHTEGGLSDPLSGRLCILYRNEQEPFLTNARKSKSSLFVPLDSYEYISEKVVPIHIEAHISVPKTVFTVHTGNKMVLWDGNHVAWNKGPHFSLSDLL